MRMLTVTLRKVVVLSLLSLLSYLMLDLFFNQCFHVFSVYLEIQTVQILLFKLKKLHS